MMMINYRQLDEGFRRMVESERRCGEFASFLTNNNRRRKMGNHNNDSERRFSRVDEQQVQSCIATYISSHPTNIKNNNHHSYNYQLVNPKNTNTTNLTTNDCYEQQESRNSFLKDIQQQQHSLSINQQSKESDQDEYFEMEIVLNGEMMRECEVIGLRENECHQVKIFQTERHTNNPSASKSSLYSNQHFNLSNFSSFNNHNPSQSNNQLSNSTNTLYQQQQRSFYQQQLSYLIKKIQFIHGRKLSTKGITKIIDSLYSMTGEGFSSNELNGISCNGYSSNEADLNNNNMYDRDIVMLKDITINEHNVTHSRVKSKNNKPIKPVSNNTNKKIQFSTQPQSQTKLKSKIINKIYSSKNQANKENQNFPFVQKGTKSNKTQKQQTKGKQRSVSPLSYRVLMQKKKILLKPQKPLSNQQQIHEHHSGQSLPQSFQSSSTKPFSSRPHCLKIIFEKIHLNQNLSKALSFQCHLDSHKPVQIKKQVQRYCEQNLINKTNVNIIMEALTQRRPIITIKSRGIQ